MLEDVALARAAEADVLAANGYMWGAVYLAGYVVECRLGALLNRLGKPFPTSGEDGHDLREMWVAAGFQVADATGRRSAFLAAWDTSLRYSCRLPGQYDAADLLRGARELAAYITVRTRYVRPVNRGSSGVW